MNKIILIIEDDPTIRSILTRMLAKHNTVTAVANGRDAIAVLQQIAFDAVLSDYDLKDLVTGEDILVWIRNNQPELAEKFIFHSSTPEAQDLNVPCLVKPSSHRVICQTIADLPRTVC